MHTIQSSILDLLKNQEAIPLKLREIGRSIHVQHPQLVKYHLQRLEKRGLIKFDFENNQIIKYGQNEDENNPLVSLPIYGVSNCGVATAFSQDQIEGFLKISKRVLLNNKNLFVLRAKGDSMNRANINNMSIEDGDYLLVDPEEKIPNNRDYFVSIIDNCANVKRIMVNKDSNQIYLISESNKNYPPIIIHQDDNYLICGKVVQVIKKPKVSWEA